MPKLFQMSLVVRPIVFFLDIYKKYTIITINLKTGMFLYGDMSIQSFFYKANNI